MAKNKTAEKNTKPVRAEAAQNRGKVRKFFRDIRSEFKKISWPSKKQVWNNTVVVIVTVLIFGVVVWTLDFLLVSGRDLLLSLF